MHRRQSSVLRRTVYQTYLDRFMSEVGTDALSFDFYPFQANSSTDKDYLRNMLRNLSDIALSAKKNGVPAWGFIQDSSWDALRMRGYRSSRIPVR